MGGADVAEQIRASRPPPAAFEVHEDNWPVVEVFTAMDTQWRYAYGHPTGLDYGVLEKVASYLGREDGPELFQGLRVMEAEALRIWGEERRRREADLLAKLRRR